MASASPPLISASEVGDYAFCPRSYWYRHHPPDAAPDPASVRRSAAGVAYHARALRGERHRAEHAAAYAALVVAGLVALALGLLWVFRPF
jgi:hypothetical protein